MKTIKTIFAICIVLAIISLSSCSKSIEESNPLTPRGDSVSESVAKDKNSVDDRFMGITEDQSLGAGTIATIDTSLYPLHIRDNYQDHLYLKPISNIGSILYGFYAYEGKFVHSSFEFNAVLIYYKSTKTFSASLGYFNDQVFDYHCKWQSTNYFRGSYCTMNPSSFYTNKQRDVRCTIIKGSLPDMNL